MLLTYLLVLKSENSLTLHSNLLQKVVLESLHARLKSPNALWRLGSNFTRKPSYKDGACIPLFLVRLAAGLAEVKPSCSELTRGDLKSLLTLGIFSDSPDQNVKPETSFSVWF